MALVENLTKHGQKEEGYGVSQGSSDGGGYIVGVYFHSPAKDDGPDGEDAGKGTGDTGRDDGSRDHQHRFIE